MTHNPSDEPMEVGEIISTGWRLYRSNFAQYLLIAFVATLWSLAPTVFNLLINFGPIYLDKPLSPGIAILLLLVLFAFSIFCAAQSLAHFAGISRLAYQSLSGTTETPDVALRFTHSRKFSFLGATLLQSILIFLIAIALVLLLGVFVGIVAAVTGLSGDNSTVAILFGLIAVVSVVAFFFAYLYIVARLMLIEQPIAIEPSSDVFDAVSRSWQLTKRHVGRAMLVSSWLFLIVVAIFVAVLGIAVSTTLGSALEVLSAPNVDPQEALSVLLPLYITLVVIGIAISILVLPLFKTTFTVLYFDLRNRFERRAFRENLEANPSADL